MNPRRRAYRAPVRPRARLGLPLILLLAGLNIFFGCASGAERGAAARPTDKILFDLARLNEEGLQGPPDGLRALDYEFCVPDTGACRSEVRGIDPTVHFMEGSRGRSDCGPDQVLCIGTTHQARFARVLRDLAALPYVDRIQECFYE